MAKAPGAGILYYLATCRAKLGQNASAYRLYRQLAETMTRQGEKERARVAQQQADKIERRLIFMRIAVSELSIGLVIKRNGRRITTEDFAGAPIDPGRYTIEATAPGMRPFSTVVEARQPGTTLIVTIPQLDDPDPPEPVVIIKTRHLRVQSGRPNRIAAWVLGGVAVAGAVTGAVTLALAFDKKDAAAPHCPLPDACYSPGAELIEEARALQTIATIGFVAAGALSGGAVTLALTAPDDDALDEPPAVGLVIGPTGGALQVRW